VPTIYGIQRVPCDTYMREILDPVSPQGLRPVFTSVLRQLQRGKALEPMTLLDGSSLLALDGTESFSSKTMHGASGVHRVPRNGSITSTHQMLGAAIVHPDQRAVMPLMPAPIVHRDGTATKDGARHAAKRFVAKLRQDHPHLKCMVTEDSLRSHAPHIATLHDDDLPSILGGKEGDHASLCQQVQAAEHAERVTWYARHDRAAGLVHRLRFLHDVPLKASHVEVRVNCSAYGEMGQDKVQHCSWITDLRVTIRHVLHLMRGGRVRWKIAKETCNILKNQGDHFEHTYGHGAQHRSVVVAVLRMLAFLVDQAQPLGWAWFRAGWRKLGSKRLLWERRRALFSTDALTSMRQLCEALLYGFKRSSPLVPTDSSSSLSMSAVTACHHPRALPSWRSWRRQDETRLPAISPCLTSHRKSLCQRRP
jgi:hypothetical protein